MNDIAIHVDNLSKSYPIVHNTGKRYKTLQEAIINYVRNPFRQNAGEQKENFWALRDVSFELKHGEVLGIIGRNGAGKSTLLKILSRITRPTSGRATVNGRIGSLLEVGTGFHPELTGRENVFLGGAILGMNRRDIAKRLDEIVTFAEVEKFIDTPVKRYSSGMYMRLAFAVAAHLEPDILIVDEVLAVGDAEFQKKCLGKMGDVAHSGRTVLFVSHNMNAIEELCTSALLLNRGQVKMRGDQVRSVIMEYLKSGDSEGTLAHEWVNAADEFKNPYFQPLRMSIVDAQGQKLPMPFRNDGDAFVEIHANIESLDPALTIGYAIYTDSGQLLYWSYQTDRGESNWPKLHTGTCVLRGRLPAHLLNEGDYRIELAGGLHFRQWLFEPGVNAPSIHVQIQGGLSESPYWLQKRPGLLAPVIEWFTL